jgi:thioredoxin-related protein
MKWMILTIGLVLIGGKADEPGIEWITLEEAQERAATEPRNVIVDMYTDWCGWCKKMDKTTFVDPSVAAFANEHYYAVKINAESSAVIDFMGEKTNGRKLAQEFNVPGFPTYILLDKSFDLKEQVIGYKSEKDFLKILTRFSKTNP